jgi:uncharacterized iron-regulated membrane protein
MAFYGRPAFGLGRRIVKLWYLKLHRWLALVFALPLVLVILSGLVLSFEPALVERSIAPGTLDAAKVVALLQRADPQGQAKMLSYRSYDNTLSIGSAPGRPGVTLDVATGQPAQVSALATLMTTARRLHETLLVNAGWLVVSSTLAMLAMIGLGILLGLPRFANSLAGWHKGTAWALLPLLVLSPLSALLITMGVTFSAPLPAAPNADATAPGLVQSVQVLAVDHDLSDLIWIRSQGSRVLARLAEDGEYRVYLVSAAGVQAMARNWPRLWHEGNFAGDIGVFLNAVVSVALIGLLVSGIWLWLRRRLRMARARARAIPAHNASA